MGSPHGPVPRGPVPPGPGTAGRARKEGRRAKVPSLYHQLLEEVLEGRLRPGEVLVETALGKRFGVSRTPIREALRMLEQDGVLERVNRGMRVRQTSSEEVLEIYGVRTILEAAAARDAAAKRSDYDLATLDRIFGSMAEAKGATPLELAEINRSFHRAIWQASRNRTLMDLLERLAVHLRRYPATTYQRHGRWEEALEEHRQLLEAIRAQEPDRAAEVAERHMQASRDVRIDMIRNGTAELTSH
jgi:DNA-binding GntR family transcriptional regulator